MSFSLTSFNRVLFIGILERIQFKIHQVSNGYRGAYGKVTIVINQSNFPDVTSELPINCGNKTFNFIFTGRDYVDPLKLDPYDGVSSGPQFLRYLSDQLQSHPFFQENIVVRYLYFNSTTNIGAIELEAKVLGFDFALGFDPPINLTLESTSQAFLAPNGNYPNNLTAKLLLSVYLDNLHNPQRIDLPAMYSSAKIDKAADTGTFDFLELNDAVRPLLGFDIPFNIWDAFYLRFFLVPTKLFISTIADNGSSENGKLLDGGVNAVNFFANYGKTSEQYLNFISRPNHIFIVENFEKVTTQKSLEFLAIDTPGSEGRWRVQFDVYYDDNSSANTYWDLYIPFDCIQCIPTSWIQNHLGDLQPSKTAFKYIVSVTLLGTDLTESYTYYIDHRIFPFWKQFVFQSAIGYPDTIYLHGASKNTMKMKRESYQLAISDEPKTAIGTWEVTASQAYDEFIFRSGWLLSKAELERWKKFLSSLYIGMVPDTLLYCDYTEDLIATNILKQPYIKMSVVSDSIDITEEKDFLFAVQFVLRKAFEDKNYIEVPSTLELYYDSEVSFSISKIDLAAGEEIIDFLVQVNDGGYYDVLINGESFPSGTINLNNNDVLHFVIKAYKLKRVQLQPTYSNATISFTKIETIDLQFLVLLGFSHTLETLYKRLENLLSLQVLSINSSNPIDSTRIFSQTLKLLQAGGKITDIVMPATTPTALGYELVNAIVDNYSITIITL